LIAYSVARRTREVGIRVSIGAQRGHVLWLFIRESAALVAAGMAIGLPLAVGLARLVRGMLHHVSPNDPGDMALTLAALAIGGLAAAYLPSRRATRIDPVRALRHD
jgi:ABC-type antimicrobial peptide transport system permease subunit